MSLMPAVTATGPRTAPTPEERAILGTVVYAGLFQCPLSVSQLAAGLLELRLEEAAIREWLRRPFLRARVEVAGASVFPRGQGAWLALKHRRTEHTRGLLSRHARSLRFLGAFPFVRLVALSGACAHENADDDDVDVFLVVKRERAWGVALALMVLSKLIGQRRTLCLNYIVDEDALALPETDVFTASEIASLRPLAGAAAYRAFVGANPWMARRMPNFWDAHATKAGAIPDAGSPRWLEPCLERSLAPLLERCARWALGLHFRRKWGAHHPGVALSGHRLKLHAVDHGPRLRASFAEALRAARDEDD